MLRYIEKLSRSTALWGVTDVSEECAACILRVTNKRSRQPANSFLLSGYLVGLLFNLGDAGSEFLKNVNFACLA
jgi:hypothetical protein